MGLVVEGTSPCTTARIPIRGRVVFKFSLEALSCAATVWDTRPCTPRRKIDSKGLSKASRRRHSLLRNMVTQLTLTGMHIRTHIHSRKARYRNHSHTLGKAISNPSRRDNISSSYLLRVSRSELPWTFLVGKCGRGCRS